MLMEALEAARRLGGEAPNVARRRRLRRTQLIKPTSRPGNCRELRYVSWVHPAYANKHVYTRNDEEMISVSLNPTDYE